ncbi:MAG: hypothetical protein PV344_05180, partial [Anaplasma sp.]|nr:hypothetical protein [Anaplasma sp.]
LRHRVLFHLNQIHQIAPGGNERLLAFIYCKRLNFRGDLIFANFANRLRFAKNRSREQFGQCANTTVPTFDSRKLEPANNFKFIALAQFAKI